MNQKELTEKLKTVLLIALCLLYVFGLWTDLQHTNQIGEVLEFTTTTIEAATSNARSIATNAVSITTLNETLGNLAHNVGVLHNRIDDQNDYRHGQIEDIYTQIIDIRNHLQTLYDSILELEIEIGLDKYEEYMEDK